jgi:hypothetical protein
MRRNVTVFFFFALFSLSFSKVYAQAYALWPNSPGSPTSLAPTTSGNVQASAMTYVGNLTTYTSYSTGTKTIASYIGLEASYSGGWGTSWTSTGTGAVYEQYVIAPASGYNLNMTGVELYLGCSNTSGAMKVQLAYSTDGTNFTTFASNSLVNSTITAAGGGQNGLYLSGTNGMTTGASTSAFSSRINYWSTSFNSTALSVSNGGSFYLRVYPYVTLATTSHWLAVANVKLKGTATSAGSLTTNPTSYNFGNIAAGSSSAAQSFTVTAVGASSSISVSAPSGFEVSSDGSTYGTTATIASTGGTLYARFSPSSGTGGTGTVNIALTSGALSANIAVQGFAYSAEPTSQSTISFGTVDGNSIVINLATAGNGSNHLIVAKSGSAVSWTPTDLTDYTSGTNANYGTATDQGSGNKVVYNSTLTGNGVVTVQGLTPGATYYFAVYDFNVSATGTQNYLTSSPGTGSQATTSTPTLVLSKSSIAFGEAVVNSTSAEQTFTLSGSYLTGAPANLTVTAPTGFEVSLSSGSGFSSSVSVPYASATLSATTIYAHFKPASVAAYSGVNIACTGGGAGEEDLAVTGTGIAVPAPTSLAIAQTSDNIVRLTWTAPVNTYEKVLVFARPAGDITHTPSGAGSAYNNANADITTAGVYSTDNYLVYAGTGTSVEVTGLTAGTTYYFNAIAYEGNAWSSTATSVNATANIHDVTSLTGTGGDAQIALAWSNPAYSGTQSNYWDEVLVVVREASANDGTPSGDGSSYSSGATAFGAGTAIGSGFVVYKGTAAAVTVTGLTNGSVYYLKAYVRHGSVWSAGSEINVTAVPYAVGDFGSVASSDWGTYATAWKKWSGSGWATAPTAAPTTNDNVWIIGGYTITLPSSGTLNCKNLHVINGQLCKSTTPSSVSSPRYMLLYGTILEVGSNGILGNTAAGDSADGISFDVENDTLAIIGTGGTCSINRLRTNIASTYLTIDRDVTLNYHGSSNAGNAFAYYTVAGDNNTLTINPGKTLTFAPWACYNGVSSSHGLATTSQTINVNGTLTFQPGRPAGNTATPGWGFTNYFDLGTTSGKTCALNIGSSGTLNVTKFYPNGSKVDWTAGKGALITITNNGTINISDTADFRNTTQTIAGSGTVNITGPFLIGSPTGISASDATGPILTTTRLYNASRFEYADTVAAQSTGNGLPSTVAALTIKNPTGVTLTNSLTVNGTLIVASGDLITGSNTVTLGSSATLSETAGSMVLGNLTTSRSVLQSTANAFGGIGVTITAADAAPGSTSVTRVTGTALTGNSNNSIKRYYTINPSTNSGLNATLVFKYDDRTAELNSLTESTLQLFKSTDAGSTWTLGAGTLDATANTITLNGITDFSMWTAGSSTSPLPVELTSLTASVSGRDIALAWKTATEVNVSKFVVERSLNGKWSTAGDVAAFGNSSSPRNYSFVDKNLAVGKYTYRLKMVDNDGTYEYSTIMATAEVSVPTEFSVAQNYPNPFNPGTMVSFELPNDAQVVVELYAVTGSKIATVSNSHLNAGYNSFYLSMSKYNLPSGAYFYKVTASESGTGKTYSQIRKMVYMK